MIKNWKTVLISLLIFGVFIIPGIGFGMYPGPEIKSMVNRIKLGTPVSYRNLTLYPLILCGGGSRKNFLTLDEAMERSLLTIEEKGGGNVSEVMVTNRSSMPVFIFAGEIIAGAKQDRIVRRDTLLAPCGGRMCLSVYCVEQGRWHGESNRFKPAYCNAGAYLRKITQTGASQAEIWDGVREKNRKLGVAPLTGTLRAVYTDGAKRKIFNEYIAGLGGMPDLTPGMVGVVVCSAGKIVCGDIFESPGLFQAEWEKLLSSYISDGLASFSCGRMVEPWRIESFLSHLHDPESVIRKRGVSLGDNIRLTWSTGVASGILYRGFPVHLSLFSHEGKWAYPHRGDVLGIEERRDLSR